MIALSIALLSIGSPLIDSASGVGIYHSVTFVENDNSNDPVFAIQSSNVATDLTSITSVSPAFLNVGFTFVDWNTSPDGTGVSYANGSLYSFTASIDLFAIWSGIFHSVTFLENDTPADDVSAIQSANRPTPLTSLSSMSPAMVNPGFSFVDWNTSADGSGTSYANGADFNFSQTIGLFAIWQAVPTITQSFISNGGSGTLAAITSEVGTPTTLPPASGMLNVGYSFSGWNTAADGSGTQYASGATYTFSESQVLYAQWVPDVYLVTYAYGGGVIGATTATYSVGSTALILPNSTNGGFNFLGWFSQSSGGVLIGLPGDSFTPSASATLFAQWTPVAIYSIDFSANGATGSISAMSGEDSSQIVLPTVTGLSDIGYAFSGWNTLADGSGDQFAGGSSFTIASNQTLYAQWVLGPTVTLTFDANGGSGSVSSIIGAPGSTVILPDQSGLIFTGYLVSAWNTNSKGTGKSYSFGQALKLTGSTVLYAQWKGHRSVMLFGAIGSFRKNSSSLSSALKSQVDRIALTIKLKKFSSVTLYGYTAATGLASLNISLSRARALHVAQFLRLRLTEIKAKGVVIRSAGEGAIAGETGSSYSRVEVFGV